MKKLYIIRHAKSSWKDLSLDDFDRPLNKRGRLNAPLMGSKLKERGVKPDIVISSPALRAKLTAEIIAKEIKYSNDIIFYKDIYEASVSKLEEILMNVDNKHDTIFLFGHNQSLNSLAERYVNFGENIPTCGIVEIKFKCNKWSDISYDNAQFVSFDYPKKYKQPSVY